MADPTMNQDIVNGIMAAGGGGIGWVLKTIWDALGQLKDDLSALQKEIHTSYVSKDDYRQDVGEIKNMLKAIFEKLDKKADK
jgi:hypothetical protein